MLFNIDTFITGLGCLVVLALLGSLIFAPIWKQTDEKKPSAEVEPCHLVRDKKRGYPMTVNDKELADAMRSGNYELVEKYHGDGCQYSDGEHDTYIPPGHRLTR